MLGGLLLNSEVRTGHGSFPLGKGQHRYRLQQQPVSLVVTWERKSFKFSANCVGLGVEGPEPRSLHRKGYSELQIYLPPLPSWKRSPRLCVNGHHLSQVPSKTAIYWSQSEALWGKIIAQQQKILIFFHFSLLVLVTILFWSFFMNSFELISICLIWGILYSHLLFSSAFPPFFLQPSSVSHDIPFSIRS